MSEPYKSDLAYIHDVGHGDLARAATETLLAALRRRGRNSGRVVDLGCGSGILAELLLGAGYDVTGFDLSEAMITTARRRAPRADLQVASFLDAEIPQGAIAVTAIGEVFSYLFDEQAAGAALDRLFARVHAALERRGIFLFDVVSPGRLRGESPQRYWREGDDWAVLIEIDEDPVDCRLSRSITTFRRVGRHEAWHRDHEVHHLREHPRRELEARLRAVGFRVRSMSGYGAMRFGPGHTGFCARKP